MIELPGRRARPNALILFLIFAIVAILLGKSTAALSYYVDALWFGSLGYSEVFWKSLGLEWTAFGVFFASVGKPTAGRTEEDSTSLCSPLLGPLKAGQLPAKACFVDK